MPDDVSTLAGRALSDEWRIRFHVSFVFEVDAAPLEARLPEGVSLSEVVPGVGLLSVIHAQYAPDTLGRPTFDEIVCSAVVAPDLSLDMPPPRLTFHVLDVWSNDATFVEHKRAALRMPVHHAPTLTSEVDADGLGSRVRDERGPIFALRYGAAPRFVDRAFVGQYFARPDRDLHHGVWRWSGTLAEHQRRQRPAALQPAHPFFAAAGLERGDPPAYLQQVSRPGDEVRMWTYAPRTLS